MPIMTTPPSTAKEATSLARLLLAARPASSFSLRSRKCVSSNSPPSMAAWRSASVTGTHRGMPAERYAGRIIESGYWNVAFAARVALEVPVPDGFAGPVLVSYALRVPVVQHDDGTVEGMHDLDVLYPDRPCAAVEVTTAADGESIALWNLLNGGGRWIEPTLRGGWAVSLLPTARAKRVRKELPPLLEMLERSGIKEVHVGHFRADPALVQLASDLGVSDLSQSDTSFPGSIYPTVELGSDRSGGMVAETGEALGTWVGGFLLGDERRDVREKLLRSG